MRVKQIWDFVPLPKNLKLMWDRITVSRLTIFYFVFSLLHCFIQVVLQIQAFIVNEQAAVLLDSVVDQGGAAIKKGFPVFTKNELRVCEKVPASFSVESCQLIWNGTRFADLNKTDGEYSSVTDKNKNNAVSMSASASSIIQTLSSSIVSSSSSSAVVSVPTPASSSSRSFRPLGPPASTFSGVDISTPSASPESTTTVFVVATPTTAPQSKRDHPNVGNVAVKVDGMNSVQVTGLGWHDETFSLSQKCLVTLNWPVMKLDNTKREDITFIAFQFWVLGMSIVAILNESIPHIIASLLTHVIATAWAVFQVLHTRRFKMDFNALTTDGACGRNLLVAYWKARSQAEIPGLVLNVVALIVSAYLTWRIIKLFGWQTFKRIGASREINSVYKVVLTLSIVIQLAIFFVLASAGIWIDQLCNGVIARSAYHKAGYVASIIVVAVLLCPWLVIGWIAVRREHNIMMAIFLALCLGYLGGWGSMFQARVLRWTYLEWTFFNMMYTAAAVLVLAAFILGVWSRMNFGKGLPNYLNTQEALPGDDFVAVTEGKVSDPERLQRSNTSGSSWSTFSSGSNANEKVQFPSSSGPIPTFADAYGPDPRAAIPSHMRGSPTETIGASLARSNSNQSDHSVRSQSSLASVGGSKRWVIE